MPERYTVNITAENGIVERSPALDEYDAGSELILTATPAEGFVFDEWRGDTVSSDNPLTVRVDSVLDISASFILETGYQSEWFSKDLIIYPNPVDKQLNVKNIPAGASITIVNMEGRQMIKLEADEKCSSIDVSDLNPGIYLLSVMNEPEKTIMKLIVN